MPKQSNPTSESGMVLRALDVKVCQSVCEWYDDPVGEPSGLAELRERVGPEVTLQQVERLRDAGYLTQSNWKMIGNEDYVGPVCFSPTDEARKLLPDRYPPPIGTARRFEDELAEYETWQATGERGPCPLCGATTGQMHGRKYCFGENVKPVGAQCPQLKKIV